MKLAIRLHRAWLALTGRRELAFKGADFNRLTFDWSVGRSTADDEVRFSLARLRARGRDLGRNSPYVRQYLNLLAVNVVGPDGIKLQAQVRNNDDKLNKRINDTIEAAWRDWSSEPTVDGKLTLVRFEHLALTTIAKEGEVFIRLHRGFDNRYAFALEMIDPDLVDEMLNRPAGDRGPEIRMGIEVDDFGRPVAYHVWDSPATIGGSPAPRNRIRIPADQIMHLYRSDRPNQTRGISWLAPVMIALKMLESYEEAELVASRVQASAMGFFTRKEGLSGEATPDKDGKLSMEANPGTFAFAPEGYDLASWDPQRPNANFQSFVKGVLRMIASGLGLSYNVLANDLEGVNYSSMRSGLLIERDLWRALQTWWIGAFRERIYREWMNLALLSDGLILDSRDPRKFLAARWTPRGWPWVDPQKDAAASLIEIGAGLNSRTNVLAEQGRDFEDNLEQLAEEKRLALEHGVEIEIKPPAASSASPAPPVDEPATPPARSEVLAALRRNGGTHR